MTDPYAANPYIDPDIPCGPGGIDYRAIAALRDTRPWVKVFSVSGFIVSGLLLSGAVVLIATGLLAREPAGRALPIPGLPMLIGMVYLVVGSLFLVPSVKLWRYGSAITRLMMSSSQGNLAKALDLQRSFWKCAAILTLVLIVLYCVLIGFIVAGATSHAFSR